MAAPICATCLARPRRSSRAKSRPCSVAGTADAPSGAAEAALPPGLSATSRTALVSSSTKSGTPSVRPTICSRRVLDKIWAPATCRASSAQSRRSRRLSDSGVTPGWPSHGASKSPRQVTSSNTGTVRKRRIAKDRTSSEVGSIQCTSSNTMTTGLRRAISATWPTSASIVLCFLRCGSRLTDWYDSAQPAAPTIPPATPRPRRRSRFARACPSAW